MTPILPLYPYQTRWVADKSRWKCWLASRQCGKSWASAVDIALDMHRASAEGRKSPWLLLSRGERQAIELMVSVRKAFDMLAAAGAPTPASCKSQEIMLDAHNVVTALPANPDSIRGYSRNIMLDEAAFHIAPDEIWRAIVPTVTRGWRCSMVSTANEPDGIFHHVVTEKPKPWSVHRTTIEDAVAEGLDVNVEELREAVADDITWSAEYLCSFVAQGREWVAPEFVRAAQTDAVPAEGEGDWFLGIDVGRDHDLTVIVALDENWAMRGMTTMKSTAANAQVEAVAEYTRRFNVKKIAVDQTGIGRLFVDNLGDAVGESRVEGIVFTQQSKLDLATRLRRAFVEGNCAISKDRALFADICALRRYVTPSGGIRIDAPRDASGHADRAWALALAMHAADQRLPVEGGVAQTPSAYARLMDEIL